MLSTETALYTKTAKTLHWLIAAALVCMLTMGWTFDFFTGTTKFFLIQLHKSVGITILLLSLMRLGWRAIHRAPPLPDYLSKTEKMAAHTVHGLLYIVMITMPLSGWAMVSASPLNLPTILYGVVPWPNMPFLSTLGNRREVSHFFGDVHGLVAYMLAALAAGHAAAAMKHHFIAHDDLLLRMAPRCCAPFLNRLRGRA
jgi:cytochrome b561